MKHTTKSATSKRMRTLLSLLLVLSMLVGCGLMFAGCTENPATTDNSVTPDVPADEVVDKKNDPAEYAGLEKGALLKKLAVNHLGYYVDKAANTTVNPLAGGKMDMTLTVGDTIVNMLEEGMEGADLSFLNQINVSMDLGKSGETIKMAMRLGLNSTDIVTANVLMDLASGMAYLGVPELNERWIALDMGAMTENGGETEEMAAMLNTLPDPQILSALLERYLNIALTELNDVEQSTETLEVGGIRQDCTALTLTIDQASAMRAIKAVLTEAKNDTQIKEILMNLAGEAYTEQAYGEFQQQIDEMIGEMDEAVAGSDSTEYIRLVTYVDSNYNIAGMVLSGMGFAEELSFYNLIADGKFAFETNLPAMLMSAPAGQSKIIGAGTVEGGKTEGTYTWLTGENQVLLNVFTVTDAESGKVTLRPETALLEAMNITLPFVEMGIQIKWSAESVELNLLSASTLLVGISLRTTPSTGPNISVPEDYVDGMDSEQMQQWVENLDFEKLLNNLKAAGIPQELIDALTGAMSAEPEYSEPEYNWTA